MTSLYALISGYIVIQCILLNRFSHGIDCYQCSRIQNISDCHNLAQCNTDEYCFTDTTGLGMYTHFTMGCRPKQQCLAAEPLTTTPTTTTTTMSLSIIGRSATSSIECSQCCAIDACNKQLCTTGTQAVGNGQCEDDPTFNCPSVSSVFNICIDKQHAKLKCKKFCGLCNITDGGWSNWQPWSSCSVTCAPGTQDRIRFCDNPLPNDGGLYCIGDNTEQRTCNQRACPVHGGWSLWSPWGECSVTCGIGLSRRDRVCSNPYPGPDGQPCWGDARDDRTCFIKACADGKWTAWSNWGSCSASCLGGIQTKTRTCTNPAPSEFGHACIGNSATNQPCNQHDCPVTNGGWSSWSSWGSCSASCLGGIQSRTRMCSNPAPSKFGHDCVGNSEEMQLCSTHNCPVTNGGWSSWASWGVCTNALKTRKRLCNNPVPSRYGQNCLGNNEQVGFCGEAFGGVRLVNGHSDISGRLEVFHTKWGTVCDDSFSDAEAKVVCEMLGIETSGKPYAKGSAFFGQGSLPIILDDVNCNGSEESIYSCNHLAWFNDNCGHTEDVGVVCAPPIRLVGGTSHSGRLEVKHNGEWGTVCDDGFNTNAAKVVCRSLGLSTSNNQFLNSQRMGSFASANSNNHGTGTIMLDDVSCTGTERSLEECRHRGWRSHDCGHDEDISVVCG